LTNRASAAKQSERLKSALLDAVHAPSSDTAHLDQSGSNGFDEGEKQYRVKQQRPDAQGTRRISLGLILRRLLYPLNGSLYEIAESIFRAKRPWQKQCSPDADNEPMFNGSQLQP
jgi:hypothetical protein